MQREMMNLHILISMDLKAGLQGYSDVVVHTLVVSDACESGPGFYSASRSANEAPTCDNTLVAGAKSAQVFSSAGEV